MAAQESTSTPDLRTRVALVTGASRGVGRGVALGLAHAGARVFATGRSIGRSDPISGVTTLVCDHTDDHAVASVFGQIDRDAGTLDILVNVAWGGYERMVEDGRFTWGAPFWEQPDWRWEAMITAGVRAAFVASQHAARRMVPAGRGLIVHVSSLAGRKYAGNVIFIGRAVAALAGGPDVGRWNGSVLVAAALAQEYGFTDIDGRIPQPLEWNGA